MLKLKPVWRMNTSNVVPSDRMLYGAVLYKHGFLFDEGYNNFNWSINSPDCYLIVAYQTNRTKAAKYERNECQVCDGKGWRKLKDWITKRPFRGVCIYCNGKGATWRKSNGN